MTPYHVERGGFLGIQEVAQVFHEWSKRLPSPNKPTITLFGPRVALFGPRKRWS